MKSANSQIPVVLVVAASENGVIGAAGTLPWHIPEDLKHFKALTFSKPCIMGRKTWQSLPRRPLPGRTNIVVSRDPEFRAEGARLAADFESALRLAAQENPHEIAVIGGEKVFAAALPHATRIYSTEISGHIGGDAFMPRFDRSQWRETGRDGPHQSGSLHYSFVTLEKIPGK